MLLGGGGATLPPPPCCVWWKSLSFLCMKRVVFCCVQSLFFVADPYFRDPGYSNYSIRCLCLGMVACNRISPGCSTLVASDRHGRLMSVACDVRRDLQLQFRELITLTTTPNTCSSLYERGTRLKSFESIEGLLPTNDCKVPRYNNMKPIRTSYSIFFREEVFRLNTSS